jgi:hypothetical protein
MKNEFVFLNLGSYDLQVSFQYLCACFHVYDLLVSNSVGHQYCNAHDKLV